MPTYTDSICSPAMTSASSTAFLTASMAWSRLMMLPRRVPFIGEVPLPMISSWLRSLASPTSTQTLDVPMSSATTYFSSVFGMYDSLHWQQPGCRAEARPAGWFDDDAIGEAQIGVFDGSAIELLGARDGVQVAPLRREVVRVRVDHRAELAVEQREGVGGDGTDLGEARVHVRVARAQRASDCVCRQIQPAPASTAATASTRLPARMMRWIWMRRWLRRSAATSAGRKKRSVVS